MRAAVDSTPDRSRRLPWPSRFSTRAALPPIVIPAPGCLISSACSNTATLAPFWIRAPAAVSPPIPAPMTAMSIVALLPSHAPSPTTGPVGPHPRPGRMPLARSIRRVLLREIAVRLTAGEAFARDLAGAGLERLLPGRSDRATMVLEAHDAFG